MHFHVLSNSLYKFRFRIILTCSRTRLPSFFIATQIFISPANMSMVEKTITWTNQKMTLFSLLRYCYPYFPHENFQHFLSPKWWKDLLFLQNNSIQYTGADNVKILQYLISRSINICKDVILQDRFMFKQKNIQEPQSQTYKKKLLKKKPACNKFLMR